MTRQADELQLDTLPSELLLLLSAYLPVSVVHARLRLVCRRFRRLFGDERIWKARLQSRFPRVKFTTAFATSDAFDWRRCCAAVEREHRRWVGSRPERGAIKPGPDYRLVGGHYACVDAVHLFRPAGAETLCCASGSRDRGITVCSLQSLANRERSLSGEVDVDASDSQNHVRLTEAAQAHSGWIWCIGSDPTDGSRLYSTGWDYYVKQWQLSTERLELAASAKQSAAVVSLAVSDGWLAAGTYDQRINVLDTRQIGDGSCIATLTAHAGPVLSVTCTDDGSPYMYSSSEDKSVVCTDTRMWATLHKRTLPHYATSLSYSHRSLWASTLRGYICLLQPHTDGLPSLVNLRVCNGRSVPCVRHGLGAVLCVTADRHLHVYEPNQRAVPIKKFGPFPADPTKLDYREGVLACGFADGTVGLWSPPADDY